MLESKFTHQNLQLGALGYPSELMLSLFHSLTHTPTQKFHEDQECTEYTHGQTTNQPNQGYKNKC